MNRRVSFSLIISVLLLTVLACGPLTTPTPVRGPASVPPTARLEPPTVAPAVTPETPTDTPEAQAASITPPVPQPAAAPHFHAGAPVQIDLIHMISRTAGWGISGPYVLTTADGGRTWREVMPPDPFPAGAPDKAYGAFLDEKTAWIVFSQADQILPESSVWHTTDSGQTWTRSAPLAHQVSGDAVWAEFAVLDAQNVWLMVRSVYVSTCTQHSHELFHTADGGLTWTSLDGQISDDYTGMVFRDSLEGLRTLQTTGCGYINDPPNYDVTTDGGANWESRQLPPPSDAADLFSEYINCETYQPVLIGRQGIRMLMGCTDGSDPAKQFVSYFYTSQDGSATWQTIRLPDKVQAGGDQLLYFGLNNAWLLGRDMYQSASDGQTWEYVKTVGWDGQFSFSDPQYGWAVATANKEVALVYTVDWAKTWTVIKPVIAP